MWRRAAEFRVAANSDVSGEVIQQGYQSRDARGWPNVRGHLLGQQRFARGQPAICRLDGSRAWEWGGAQGWAGMSSMR
jgi:hypothetical protein